MTDSEFMDGYHACLLDLEPRIEELEQELGSIIELIKANKRIDTQNKTPIE